MTAVLDDPIVSEDCDCAVCVRARDEDKIEIKRPMLPRTLWLTILGWAMAKTLESLIEACVGKTVAAVLKALVGLLW